MSNRLRQYAPHLKHLHKLSSKERIKFLKLHCSRDFINCFSECCHNLLKGNLRKISPHSKRILKRNVGNIKKLASKKTSLKSKSKILQKGGFLGALLGAVIPTLASLLIPR